MAATIGVVCGAELAVAIAGGAGLATLFGVDGLVVAMLAVFAIGVRVAPRRREWRVGSAVESDASSA